MHACLRSCTSSERAPARSADARARACVRAINSACTTQAVEARVFPISPLSRASGMRRRGRKVVPERHVTKYPNLRTQV
eukprot:5441076-Pleurochrysis_carterae.AAC.2